MAERQTKIDPLAIGRNLATNGAVATSEAVLSVAASRVRELLKPALETARSDGPPDERWYWAAPLLLDRLQHPGVARWLEAKDKWAWRCMAGDDDTHFAQHVDTARRFFAEPGPLGPPSADLVQVLAKASLSSPAIVALRSLGRRWPGDPTAPLTRTEPSEGEQPGPVPPRLRPAATGGAASAFAIAGG